MQPRCSTVHDGRRAIVTMTAAILTILVALAGTAEGAIFRWQANVDGNWTDPTKWTKDGAQTNEFPNSPADVVLFPFALEGERTITLRDNERITVGRINFSALDGATVRITGPGTAALIFAAVPGIAEGELIAQSNARLELRVDVLLSTSLRVQPLTQAATVVFQKINPNIPPMPLPNPPPPASVTLDGPGEMRFEGFNSVAVTVAQGLLRLANPAAASVFNLVIGDGEGPPESAIVRVVENEQIDPFRLEVKRDGLLDIVAPVETVGPVVVTDGIIRVSQNNELRITSLDMTGGALAAAAAARFSLLGNVTATASAAGPAIIQGSGDDAMLDMRDETRIFTVNDGPGNVDLAISIRVAADLAAVQLHKQGPGTMRFSGLIANTYQGATRVINGRLDLARTAATVQTLIVGEGPTPAVVSMERSGTIGVLNLGPAGTVLAAGDQSSLGGIINGGHLQIANGASWTIPSSSDLQITGGRISLVSVTSALNLSGRLFANSTPTQSAVIDGNGLVVFPIARDVIVTNGPQAIDLRIDARIVAADATARITKHGLGVALFSGINTPTGGTTVAQGTLLVTGTHAAGPITLAGGTLGGTGTVGAVIGGSGSAVAPGLSPGQLVSGPVTFGGTTTYIVEINGTAAGTGYDQLAVQGTVNLNNARLAVTAGVALPAGAAFRIIDNDGSADAVNGTFNGLAEGAKLTIGGKELTLSYRGGDGNDIVLTVGSDTDDPDDPDDPAPPTPTDLTYYLAEGATGTFFDDDVLIANPTDKPARATLTFLQEGGGTVVEQRTIPAYNRMTVHVDQIAGLADASASVRVVSTDRVPLIVERSMFWDDTYYGGHTANAVAKPEMRWIFAEGFQGFFDTYILIANVNDTETTVTLTFLRENDTPVVQTVPVAAFARKTVWAGDYPDLANRAFGIVVDATQPVIAERAMYFATQPDRRWIGGHVNTGIVAPSTSWFHAEGATGTYFNTFFLLSNPQDTAAKVDLRFLLDTGEVVTRTKTLAARQRLTINPAGEGDPRLANAALSTVVQSDVPIVSERSMYWPGLATPFGEGHNSAGVVSTALSWGLAEGRVGGPRKFDTYILLANPSETAAEVTIIYLRESGEPLVKTYTVPPTSRFNIDVKTVVPELLDTSFGARIEVTNNVPIAVERSLYWTSNGVIWEGGTNALATPLPPLP